MHISFFTFFSVSRQIPGHTVFVSYFPHFSVFPHNPGPTVCIFHISHFSLFFATIKVLQCEFLIFQVF